jgi:N-formylglutamate amidohydrolase
MERKSMPNEDGTNSASLGAGDSITPALHSLNTPELPDWVLFHVPHDSAFIPPLERSKLLLDDTELKTELLRMTDHWTFDLFAHGIPKERVFHSQVSRLVVDVERYEDDAKEIMASRGMGAVYDRTSDGKQLRSPFGAGQRQELMNAWYFPHHHRMTERIQQVLDVHGHALLIDAHSFPSLPLPYELDQRPDRPDICIGTDKFHTPPQLESDLIDTFGAAGWKVKLNVPFAGVLVPAHHYKKRNLAAVMIEVNRALYIDEKTGERKPSFTSVARTIRQHVASAVSRLKMEN